MLLVASILTYSQEVLCDDPRTKVDQEEWDEDEEGEGWEMSKRFSVVCGGSVCRVVSELPVLVLQHPLCVRKGEVRVCYYKKIHVLKIKHIHVHLN